MTYGSIGDLAQLFQARRQHADLQKTALRLSQEVTTGKVADLAATLRGDFSALADLDRRLARLDAFRTTAAEAGLFAQAQQESVGQVQAMTQALAQVLIAAPMNATESLAQAAAVEARTKLDSAVAALNTSVAGQHVLSGATTDRPPLAGAQDLLDALAVAVSGQVTAADIEAAVTAWFDAPAGGGGFLDVIYRGSTSALAAWPVGQDARVSMDLRADDPALRSALKGLALAALVAEPAVPGDLATRTALVQRAGETLTAADAGLTELRARIGSAESAIAEAVTRTGSERSASEIARAGLIAADPYATATSLQETTTQIETLYAMTARLSRLTLTDYL
jgi:flagellar hook-associated protein 3 FlgL